MAAAAEADRPLGGSDGDSRCQYLSQVSEGGVGRGSGCLYGYWIVDWVLGSEKDHPAQLGKKRCEHRENTKVGAEFEIVRKWKMDF